MKILQALMIASCLLSINALQAAEKKVEPAPAPDSTGLTPALGALAVSDKDKDALAKQDDSSKLPPSALSVMPKKEVQRPAQAHPKRSGTRPSRYAGLNKKS